MTDINPCYCGQPNSYAECCKPMHLGLQEAGTPEQLMRSRYSAFALGLADYLLKTWHVSTRPQSLDLTDSPEWIKLQVLSSSACGDCGKVHFRAFYRVGKDVGFMEEDSDFVREDGVWRYVSGDVKN